MGQFSSREFDGDPYVDLMRAIPERELVWWVQKVVWLAEGFTFADHFARTYPTLFQHKCARCKGAGTLTCPACAGLKARQGSLAGINLPEHRALSLGRLAAASAPHAGECHNCGQGGSWDDESEWEGKWAEWEAKLAYYDRAQGPLWDEWYEDVLNAGNLEVDTASAEDDGPPPGMGGAWARDDRVILKDKKRMDALIKRFGHPYDTDRLLGYQVVDPTASMGENAWNMRQMLNYLPTELNPNFGPGLVTGAADSGAGGPVGDDGDGGKLGRFLGEVEVEAAIMQNLDAAVRDLPKPHRFAPTAGTIACPDCDGAAWEYSFFPNPKVLFRTEAPFWMSTLQQMNKYWHPAPSDPSTGHVLPYGEHGLRSLLLAQQRPSPREALAGPAPESTQRYRQELELLAREPELRSSGLRLPSSASRLPRELWDSQAAAAALAGGAEGDRALEAAVRELQVPQLPGDGGEQQRQWSKSLVGSRG